MLVLLSHFMKIVFHFKETQTAAACDNNGTLNGVRVDSHLYIVQLISLLGLLLTIISTGLPEWIPVFSISYFLSFQKSSFFCSLVIVAWKRMTTSRIWLGNVFPPLSSFCCCEEQAKVSLAQLIADAPEWIFLRKSKKLFHKLQWNFGSSGDCEKDFLRCIREVI